MAKNPMVRLNKTQVEKKVSFIKDYIGANNAADASTLDSNANVSHKNIATMVAEIHKDINIQVNREMLSRKIGDLYSEDLATEYNRQLEDHEIYCHDETSLMPYCVSISMYPFLTSGMVSLGGNSGPPKHIDSFCGSFVNLVFSISSQFAGAVATVEFLMYFDYFARKDYGENYLETHRFEVSNHLQHVVYALNQPAAARGYQSAFWNISVFDEYYFKHMFGDFAFPDENFTRPEWESVSKLQDFFMDWFNEERSKSLLTFPVVTAAMVSDGETPKDKTFGKMVSDELANGNSFFIYMSDSVDSLASCCRLRNELQDNTFSYSLGAGGVATGSINVMTINMNRLVQDWDKCVLYGDFTGSLEDYLQVQIDKIHKYQIAYRRIIESFKDSGILTVYDAGYISLDKQFLTIGINGMAESAEYFDIQPGNNVEYKEYVSSLLKVIYNANKEIKKETGYMFNTEFVPAENLGVKNSKWDKKDGYFAPRECYNSYFYLVENTETSAIDKFIMHGNEMTQYLDGGSAFHWNRQEHLTSEGYLKILDVMAKTKCNYMGINVPSTICKEPDCGHIDKRYLQTCPKCGSEKISYATRVIGYLKEVSSFSSPRQNEESLRYYE